MQVEWLYVVIHNTNSVSLLKPPPKQDGVVYRIPYVYIVETGRPMNKSAKQRGTPQENMFVVYVPKHITLNDVIVVTCIIGIRTKRINGIRDILTKN